MSPPRKRRGGLIAIIAIVVVIVIIVGTVAAFAFGNKNANNNTANSNTPSASTPTTAPSPTSSVPAGFTLFKNEFFGVSYPSDWKADAGSTNDGSESFTSTTGQLFQVILQQHADESQIPTLITTLCAIFGDPIGSPTVVTFAGTTWQQETCGNNGVPVGTVEAAVHNDLLYSIDYASLVGTYTDDKTQFFGPMEQSFAFTVA
jgi:hypothetical protein